MSKKQMALLTALGLCAPLLFLSPSVGVEPTFDEPEIPFVTDGSHASILINGAETLSEAATALEQRHDEARDAEETLRAAHEELARRHAILEARVAEFAERQATKDGGLPVPTP